MQNKIAIILPVRNFGSGRYERLMRCLNSYTQMTEGLSDVYILYDDDEKEVYEPILANYPFAKGICTPSGITLMQKINIPAVEIASQYKYVGFIGDDIIFRTRWESAFIDFLSAQDYGLAFANDLIHTTGGLATHPFINSHMIIALGFFGCPAVGHHYFDNYWMRVVEKLGQIKFFPEIIMEHMHPIVGKANADNLYWLIENNLKNNSIEYTKYMQTEFENDINRIKNYSLRYSL